MRADVPPACLPVAAGGRWAVEVGRCIVGVGDAASVSVLCCMTDGAAPCCATRLRFAACLQQIPELFARLETDGVAGRDLHLHARLRVAADPFLALLDLEDAESAE